MNALNRKLIILFVSIVFLLYLYLLPKSFLGFYQAQMLANVFDLNTAIQNTPNLKSIVGYLMLIKTLNIVLDIPLFSVILISAIISFIALFIAYYFIISWFITDPDVKFFLIFLYPIIYIIISPTSIFAGYLSIYSLLLATMILYLIFNKKISFPFLIILFLSWLALSLYWHSIQVMTMAIIFIFFLLIMSTTQFNDSYKKQQFFAFLTIFLIFIISWTYFKSSFFESSLNIFQIDFDSSKFLSKGSFSNEFAFISNTPTKFFDTSRYLSYLLVEVIFMVLSLYTVYAIITKKEISNNFFVFSSVFLAQLILVPLYFFVTGSSPVILIITFLYPAAIIFLLAPEKLILKRVLNLLIITFLLIPIVLTSLGVANIYFNNNPEQKIKLTTYYPSAYWINDKFGKINIYTDAHTGGNFQLINKMYVKNDNINIISIGYHTYSDLIHHTFNHNKNSILIINQRLYDEHLIFESLESWNQFEPINKKIIYCDKELNPIFSDGNIIIFI